MQLKRTFIFLAGAFCMHSAIWAGSMGALHSNFSGFSVGAGGSYTYSTISGRTNIAMISSTPTTAEYLLSDNLTNHMAPVLNIGYLYDFHNDWLAGFKVLYKYFGQ